METHTDVNVEEIFARQDDRVARGREMDAQLTPSDGHLQVLNLQELLAREVAPREFVLEPILRQKDIAMVYAWRGVGKTYLSLAMAYAIASGSPLLRWRAPVPRRVFVSRR